MRFFRRRVVGPSAINPESLPWAQPEWRDQTVAWARQHLGDRGFTDIGFAAGVRLRPWSATLRIPTSEGSVWVKQCTSATGHEIPLMLGLWQWTTWEVPEPIVVDPAENRMILADAGQTMREIRMDSWSQSGGAMRELLRWETVLGQYADLQRATARRDAEVKRMGVPDHSPKKLIRHFERLVADGDRHGLTGEDRLQLKGIRRSVARRISALDAFGIPMAIQHDDLHDANVCVSEAGRYQIIDWGDAHRGHPFGALLVTMPALADAFGLDVEDRALLRVRDAYLEPWTDRWTREDLNQAASLAVQLAPISRALAWERALVGATSAEIAEFGHPVAHWLRQVAVSAAGRASEGLRVA